MIFVLISINSYKRRVFHAVDVEDKKVVNVFVEIKYLANETIQVEKSFTPILL